MRKYETIIGLEVHVQLSTRTKIFCGCPTVFGKGPNSQVCPVCLGQPGTLPVLNKKAFEYAVKVAFALGCQIQKKVKFDRKNYYYPDLPKNYQISQYDMPVAYQGKITIAGENGNPKDIGITRAHLEEDAGKLMHDPSFPFSYVDLNRTGTPLLEIVSEPDIRSPEEAYGYLTSLKRIIKYLEVSDCNMEEGSLRCDANVSIRPQGQKALGKKVEIKNLNSFKAVRDALAYEVLRQEETIEEGEVIHQQTRLWNEAKNVTVPMRSKEEAQDYRYFPEPDMVPFEVDTELIDRIKASLPELPEERKVKLREKYGLSENDAQTLTAEKYTADLFEETVSIYPDAQQVCNWIKGEVLKHLKTATCSLKLEPAHLANLIEMTVSGRISALVAKEVLSENISTGASPGDIVRERSLEQVSDAGELEGVISEVIKQNGKSVDDFLSGKEAALSFLVGQVMKKTKGKANPKLAGDIIKKRII